MKFALDIKDAKFGDLKIEAIKLNLDYTAEEIIAVMNAYPALVTAVLTAIKDR